MAQQRTVAVVVEEVVLAIRQPVAVAAIEKVTGTCVVKEKKNEKKEAACVGDGGVDLGGSTFFVSSLCIFISSGFVRYTFSSSCIKRFHMEEVILSIELRDDKRVVL